MPRQGVAAKPKPLKEDDNDSPSSDEDDDDHDRPKATGPVFSSLKNDADDRPAGNTP